MVIEEVDHYAVAMHDVLSGYKAFEPPRKLAVSESARLNLVIRQTGAPATPWSSELTPYMVEPLDMTASRRHEAVCFVGPARTGKTASLLLGLMAHAVVNDPGDMLMVSMTEAKARELSKTDIDRALLHSDNIAAYKTGNTRDDNTHDKMFSHGMWLKIGWPTAANLSGSTYRYAALTDLDRMPDDIDGEGPPFPLALKRTTTFMSRGMCVVESSPGRDISDPRWQPATAHEAPPTNGILGIYNMGDRRRWYWACPDCHVRFEAKPGLSLFGLPPVLQLKEIVREANLDALANDYNRVICPHCGSMIAPRWKKMLNDGGIWMPEHGADGKPVVSTIASYWMGGVAAAFQTWKSLLMREFQSLRQYDLSGDEETLRTTRNTDQGVPYLSMRLLEAAGDANDPINRKDQSFEQYVVPDWARFLEATVDVQGGLGAHFDVQVHAVGENREKTIVDRYKIRTFTDEAGNSVDIDPASVPEHWDVLTERVVRSTYRTSIEGRELQVLLTVCDTGGESKGAVADSGEKVNVTTNAYAWYRRLRRQRLHGRVMLVKGNNTGLPGLPIKETWVGARSSREKGDVPVYLLDTNRLKDTVDNNMKRTTPGPGYVHLPGWLPKSWFDELHAEVRDPKTRKWTQVRKRNETLDHLAYCEAGYLRLGADKIGDWTKAPPWAAPLAQNVNLITVEERREMKANTQVAPVPAAEQQAPVRRRRVARSGYLG